MPRKICVRHGKEYPCSCGMGNLYRFVEPVVLLLLRAKGRSCGYDLCSELQEHALTDAEIDKAALYRTLRQLEANGNVKSIWEEGRGRPGAPRLHADQGWRAAPRGMGCRARAPFEVHDPLCPRSEEGAAQAGCDRITAGDERITVSRNRDGAVSFLSSNPILTRTATKMESARWHLTDCKNSRRLLSREISYTDVHCCHGLRLSQATPRRVPGKRKTCRE